MDFNSIEFLLFFLPIFLILYTLSPGKIKNLILLSGSLIFYILGEPKSLPVLLGSVAVNFFFVRKLGRGGTAKAAGIPGIEIGQGKEKRDSGSGSKGEKSLQVIDIRRGEPARGSGGQAGRRYGYTERKKEEGSTGENGKETGREKGEKRGKIQRDGKSKMLLGTAVFLNICLLAVFKYVGKSLPIGISFYTFQSLAWLIDVYRGEVEGEVSFVEYAVGIAMFPKLLCGPIADCGALRSAVQSREFSMRNVLEGLKVFTMGLAAKVLLADPAGLLWRDVQVAGFESISTPLAWLGAVSYSLMLYFDFYGYSLMAAGLGRMLGFVLPENFKNPYMAASVRDFYRRWHMTLGGWFCRYVYIPLGGNRRGELRTVCNLLAVWVLTAVWHGATVNFLLWGLLLWFAIVMERQVEALAGRSGQRGAVGRVLSHLYLWAVIPVSWMCFAITDMGQLQTFLGRMFHIVPALRESPGDWVRALAEYGRILGIGLFACTPILQRLFRRFKDSLPGAVILAALFWWCVWRIQMEGQNPFRYLTF